MVVGTLTMPPVQAPEATGEDVAQGGQPCGPARSGDWEDRRTPKKLRGIETNGFCFIFLVKYTKE